MQRAFALMGFGSNESLWNAKYLIGYATAGLAIPSFLMYLFHVANSVKEFTDSIYITAVSIAIFISFINTVHKRSKLKILFKLIEENVNNSEYSQNHDRQNRRFAHIHFKKNRSGLICPASIEMHTDTNLLVEQITEIAFIFVTKVAAPGSFLTFIESLIYLYYLRLS